MTAPLAEQVYAIVAMISDPDAPPGTEPRMEWVEAWPKTLEGVLTATSRAAWLSAGSWPHEVHRPDGRMIGQWVNGRRADVLPGGIIRLADEKAAPGPVAR